MLDREPQARNLSKQPKTHETLQLTVFIADKVRTQVNLLKI
jgi:hypothetical protein